MTGAYSLSSFPKKHSAPMPLSGMGALLSFSCVGWGSHPGGQVMSLPASTWKWRWGTVCCPASPMLDTTR